MNRKVKAPSRSFLPHPLELALLLTFASFLLVEVFTDTGFKESVNLWSQGLWSLLPFMAQMALILLGGFVVADSRWVQAFLGRVVGFVPDGPMAYLSAFWVSALACWLNWGFGLVVSAFYARALSSKKQNLHFPLVVALSYLGFIFWHGGLSGSIPLVVNTPDHFASQWMPSLMPLSETIFSWFNILLITVLIVSLSVVILRVSQRRVEPLVPLSLHGDVLPSI
ncbi:MAG: TIGR00366 family protein [Pseudomonadota bacterium]